MRFGRLFGRWRRARARGATPLEKGSPKATEPTPEISPERLDAALQRLRAETPEPPPEPLER
jgi:hypothetical protein